MSETKRAACDRCHGQKMGCIREGTRANCNRCFDAKAKCVFSIARKAGRPSAASKRVLSISEGDGEDRIASTKPTSSQPTLDDERRREQERPATSSSHSSAGETSRDLDADFSNYFFEASGSTSLLEHVSSPMISFGIDVSSTSISTTSGTNAHPCLPWSENHGQPLRQQSSHAYLDEERGTNDEAALDTFGYLPSSPLFAYPFHEEDTGHSPQRCDGSGTAGHERERVLALEPEVTGAKAGGTSLKSCATSASGDVQVNAMQQLSELGGKLSAHTTVAPAKRSVSGHQRPYASRGSTVVNLSPNGETNAEGDDANVEVDSHIHNYIGEGNPTDRLDQLTAHVIESSNTFSSILRHIPPRASFDMAATMLILTTYIRLAQLHHTLYTLIQSILLPSETHSPLAPATATSYPTPRSSELSSSFNATTTTARTNTTATCSRSSTPVLFPYLQIGGVSLAVYPRFQLKFILEICVHHLGEVELLLGLPAESCVGGGKGSRWNGGWNGENGGILHQNTGGMTSLVRTIMMEANETVKGIRRVLASLTEELRASIQI